MHDNGLTCVVVVVVEVIVVVVVVAVDSAAFVLQVFHCTSSDDNQYQVVFVV